MNKISREKYERLMYRSLDTVTQIYVMYFYGALSDDVFNIDYKTLKELDPETKELYDFLRKYSANSSVLPSGAPILITK